MIILQFQMSWLQSMSKINETKCVALFEINPLSSMICKEMNLFLFIITFGAEFESLPTLHINL